MHQPATRFLRRGVEVKPGFSDRICVEKFKSRFPCWRFTIGLFMPLPSISTVNIYVRNCDARDAEDGIVGDLKFDVAPRKDSVFEITSSCVSIFSRGKNLKDTDVYL